MKNQSTSTRYGGFTLVEVMVVILIITVLLGLGNFGGLFNRRENARIEELAVNLIGLMDEEKTNALLGKTEGGEIARKRKIDLTLNVPGEITYKYYVDLAKNIENTFSPLPLVEKKWTLTGMTTALWECNGTTLSNIIGVPVALTIIMTGDNIAITTNPGSTHPHIILQIIRNGVSREVHIDKRTGVTYERAGDPSLLGNPSCV